MSASSVFGTALTNFRVRSTGAEYPAGSLVEAPEEKLLVWAEKGLVRIVNEEDPSSRPLFSNGRPTGATLADSPHIRVYAWSLVNLRFGLIFSPPTDLPKAAEECQLSIGEARDAFRKLLHDGDLLVEQDRRTRTDIFYLAPIKW